MIFIFLCVVFQLRKFTFPVALFCVKQSLNFIVLLYSARSELLPRISAPQNFTGFRAYSLKRISFSFRQLLPLSRDIRQDL